MARPIDTNMPNINPRIQGADETAKQLKIDKSAIDKILAKQGTLEQLMKAMGPEAVLSYFRTLSENLTNMCSRMQESEIKSLPAQRSEPKLNEFMLRDTSKGTLYQERLPEGFLTVEKLNLAAKTGLLKPEQVESIKHLFGMTTETMQMKRDDQMLQAGSPQPDQERGQDQRGQQHQQSGQHSQDQSEDDWANFSTQGTQDSGSGSPMQGSGGGLRSSMRMSIGGPGNLGVGAPPPPPQHGSSGNTQGYSSGSQGQSGVYTGYEQSYLDGNFTPNDPYYASFETLFGSENWYRSMAGNAMTNIQQIRAAKQTILAELAGLDPSKPADAKKLYILQQKLGDMQQSERQWLDNISMAQKANNERKEYIKSILDVFFQTNSAIIRNMKQ